MALSSKLLHLRGRVFLANRYTSQQMKVFAQTGVALPDQQFPIGDAHDLTAALLVLDGTTDEPVKTHITHRAHALHLAHLLPPEWQIPPALLPPPIPAAIPPELVAALAQNVATHSAESDARITQLEATISALSTPRVVETTPPVDGTPQIIPLTEDGSGVTDGGTSAATSEVGKSAPGICKLCGRKLPKKKVKQGSKCICGSTWGRTHNFCPSCGADHRPDDPAEACRCPPKIAQAATILQVDTTNRVVTAVVQTPDQATTPGTHPDVELFYPKDVIRDMAWDFLMQGRQGAVGVLHNEAESGDIIPPNGENAVVVESYLAPVTFAYRERTIMQGSWVQSYKITSDDAWERIMSGELNAPSLATDHYELEDMEDDDIQTGFTLITP